eukprot:11600925-Heterocapsa_arctica.AAC.1
MRRRALRLLLRRRVLRLLHAPTLTSAASRADAHDGCFTSRCASRSSVRRTPRRVHKRRAYAHEAGLRTLRAPLRRA